jgi:hypothetical protein
METSTDPIAARIALLERDRHAPLTGEQRSILPAKLAALDESIAALRAFRLAEGGGEPATRFHPLPPDVAADSTEPDDSRKEASHG